MKLKDFLSTLEPGQRIRIACKPGTNFIYIGTVGDIDLIDLSGRCSSLIKIIKARMESYLETHDENVPEFKTTINKYKERLQQSYMYTPIEDRDILETYHGMLEPDVLCIRIPGLESLCSYDPELPPLTSESIVSAGAQRLVGQVYIEAAEELTACQRIFRKQNVGKTYKNSIKAKMDALKRFFRNDPYHQLSDPEAIIEQCRKNSHTKTLKMLKHGVSAKGN